jgi:hypothetical protein
MRKHKVITITTDDKHNRDKGKTFLLREKPAMQGGKVGGARDLSPLPPWHHA